MNSHADRHYIQDRNQLRTFKMVIRKVDQLLVDNRIMKQVREHKRNLEHKKKHRDGWEYQNRSLESDQNTK